MHGMAGFFKCIFHLSNQLGATKENDKLPHVHGKVVVLRVDQSKKKKKKNPKSRRHLADDILSKSHLTKISRFASV